MSKQAREALEMEEPVRCGCGCGEEATEEVRLIPEWQRGRAESLRWTASVDALRATVSVAAGHEECVPGYVPPSEEGSLGLLERARWVFVAAPVPDDERAVGCDLVVGAQELILASALWADGELDTRSDGCGVSSEGRRLGLKVDNIDWPSEDEARAAVFGDEDEDEDEDGDEDEDEDGDEDEDEDGDDCAPSKQGDGQCSR